MKNILLSFALLVFSLISNAQEIEMKLSLTGYKFTKNEEHLTWKELLNTTESNVEAYNFIKKAKTNNTVSSVISFAGGFLIGIPIGQSIGKDDPNWNLAYVGGGLAVVSLPFALRALSSAKNGVVTYNESLKSTYHNQFKPEFKITTSGNGLGLRMNF